MSVLLVQLQVAVLQDMIWIANMLLDCHGLNEHITVSVTTDNT